MSLTISQANGNTRDVKHLKQKPVTLVMDYILATIVVFLRNCESEVVGITFSDSASGSVPIFFNPGPDPCPIFFF